MTFFKARGVTAGVMNMIAGDGGYRIRLDCNDNHEFWVELWIEEADLVRMLANVQRKKLEGVQVEEFTEVDQIAPFFKLIPHDHKPFGPS